MKKNRINYELTNSFKKHKFVFGTIFILETLFVVGSIVSTYFSSPIINHLIANQKQNLLKNLIILISLTGGIIFFQVLTFIFESLFFKFIRNSIRQDVLKNLSNQNLFSWNSLKNEQKIAIFNDQIESVVLLSYLPKVAIFTVFVRIVTSLLVIGFLLPLTLSFIIPLLVIGFLLNIFSLKLQEPIGKKMYMINENKTTNIIETFDNIFYIKKLNAVENFSNRFDEKELQIEKEGFSVSRSIFKLIAINSGISIIVNALVVIGVVLILTLTSFGTIGAFVPIIVLSTTMFSSSLKLVDQGASLVRGLTIKKQILASINNEQYTPLEKVSFNNLNLNLQKIELKNTKLTNFNISINSGDKILIEGPNGIGKSFILRTISGNTDQKLFSHTTNLDHLTINDLYPLIALFNYVSNEHYFFDSTLLQNLTFGNSELNAKANELLKLFNLDYLDVNQVIDQENITYSQGERQRLNLIRAILSDKKILILDEALTNIDYDNKQIVVNYLTNTNKTLIVVNHNIEPELKTQFNQFVSINQKGEQNA